jgi:hypothetical protein
MLGELFECLPEAGDVDKPKLVFFFDEAHLLFADISTAMQEKIEQVVRLIRSKGVGIYFVTQNPLDIPDKVLGQLGNRIQHALRAFTPRDQKAVKAAAETFRANPKLNVEEVITQLGVGEALVSLLDAQGIPGIVERAFIAPPVSQLEPITPEERAELIEGSGFFEKYAKTIDKESAYEKLRDKPAAAAISKRAPSSPSAGAAPYDAVAAARANIAKRQQENQALHLQEALGNQTLETRALPIAPPDQPDTPEYAAVDIAERRKEEIHQARLDKIQEDIRYKQDAAAKRPGLFSKLLQSGLTSAVRCATTQIVRGLFGTSSRRR